MQEEMFEEGNYLSESIKLRFNAKILLISNIDPITD